MNKNDVYRHLRKKGLRITPLKKEIVDLFLGGACGISLTDVHGRIEAKCNQSSVYRCLRSLADAGFLRHSLSNQEVVRYRCTDRFIPPHGHFSCSCCGEILPVAGYSREFVAEIEKRYGVKVENFDFILEGRCPDCSEEH